MVDLPVNRWWVCQSIDGGFASPSMVVSPVYRWWACRRSRRAARAPGAEDQDSRALLDSVVSERGARMTAMESATKNAGKIIGKLTLF
jgi:hypothetical protein